MAELKKRLVIIDSNSVIHRAYHALPPLTTKKGELINAIYGFLLVFLKMIKEFQPDFIAAAFDLPYPTFRHKKFPGYKAGRPKTPKELYDQIPKIKEILRAFNVPVFEKEGYEADDIAGTIAYLAAKQQVPTKLEIIILSGDSDIFQLINPETKVCALKKGVKETVVYDEKAIKEKCPGISPTQLLDFKALRGDPSDNIPGVTGIGEKTGAQLIKEFGSLENLYNEMEKETEKIKKLKPSVKKSLKDCEKQAFLSKMLVEIKKDAPIDFTLGQCRWKEFNRENVEQILKKYEFYSLIPRLPGAAVSSSAKALNSGQKSLFN